MSMKPKLRKHCKRFRQHNLQYFRLPVRIPAHAATGGEQASLGAAGRGIVGAVGIVGLDHLATARALAARSRVRARRRLGLPGTETRAMSNDAIQDLASELRSLRDRRDSPAEREESAGRLLMAAIDAGAFADRPALVGMIRQRAEQNGVNGWISAWHEAVWRLRGKPDGDASSFDDDCDMLAGEMEATATVKQAGARETEPPIGGAAEDPEPDHQDPALRRTDKQTLAALATFDASELASVITVCEAMVPIERLSHKTVGPAIKRLIQFGLAERPEGDRGGARLTLKGRRLAAKISG